MTQSGLHLHLCGESELIMANKFLKNFQKIQKRGKVSKKDSDICSNKGYSKDAVRTNHFKDEDVKGLTERKRRKNYGSTAQLTGNERQQNAQCNNRKSVKIYREIIIWLQD